VDFNKAPGGYELTTPMGVSSRQKNIVLPWACQRVLDGVICSVMSHNDGLPSSCLTVTQLAIGRCLVSTLRSSGTLLCQPDHSERAGNAAHTSGLFYEKRSSAFCCSKTDLASSHEL